MNLRKDKYIDNLIVLIIAAILFSLAFLFKNIMEINKQEVETNRDEISYSYNVSGSGNLVKKEEVKELEDSGIKYSIRSYDAIFYPYYQMLNTNERDLYNQIYANVINYKTTFIPGVVVSTKETENALEALYYDHPEFFWLDATYSFKYQTDGTVVQVTLTYNDTIKNINNAEKLLDKQINNILNVALRLDSNYDKEKYVHDVLIKNIEYDLNAAANQSAYSALVLGKTVCAGYARAFQLIMIKLGIPTYFVTGTSKNESHAWNIVLLEDGYYNIDLTWDDTTSSYNFFNNTDNLFNSTHKRESLSTKLPKCNSTDYSFNNMNRKKEELEKLEEIEDLEVIDEEHRELENEMVYTPEDIKESN